MNEEEKEYSVRIVQINGSVFGSTGKIMFGIADVADEHGMQTRCFAPVIASNRKNQPKHGYTKIGTYRSRQISEITARITGYHGCFSQVETKRMLLQIQRWKPDAIHLHNLHHSYVNLGLLFAYLKRSNIPVIWTLHDCWAFTGQCPHFSIVKCGKWKDGCHDCPQCNRYPRSYRDNTRKMWHLKKEWFTGIKNLTLVTPSQWLADLVKDSFLREYPVVVIPNGIDLSIFKPTDSDFRERYHIQNKKIVLGVAMPWNQRKGLGDFITLAAKLDETYQLVLVGLSKEQIKALPCNVIGLEKTNHAEELAGIYTVADVFVNPTYEDTFGLVNIEALACGTPVITYLTGGCPETVDAACGAVVPCGDTEALYAQIRAVCETRPYTEEDCIRSASGFAQKTCFGKYVDLYSKGNNWSGKR